MKKIQGLQAPYGATSCGIKSIFVYVMFFCFLYLFVWSIHFNYLFFILINLCLIFFFTIVVMLFSYFFIRYSLLRSLLSNMSRSGQPRDLKTLMFLSLITWIFFNKNSCSITLTAHWSAIVWFLFVVNIYIINVKIIYWCFGCLHGSIFGSFQ